MKYQAQYSEAEIERFLQSALEYTGDECIVWPFVRMATSGYGRFSKGGKSLYAHREVCRRAHGDEPFSRAHAAHSCGNGSGGCVNPQHLRWATAAQNAADKMIHGTTLSGERNHMAKLTAEQVVSILQDARPTRAIAEAYGISQSNINLIKCSDSWKHVTVGMRKARSADPRRGEGNVRATLTEAQVMAIYQDARPGIDIAAQYAVTTSCISAIKRGKSWAWLTGHKRAA